MAAPSISTSATPWAAATTSTAASSRSISAATSRAGRTSWRSTCRAPADSTWPGWLYRSAPRDGTAIAIASQVLPIEQALGTAGVQYDARRLNWIGRAAPVVEVSYTWHTSATRSLDDARQRETVMGGINPTTNTVTYLRLMNSLAGTRFKIISGYPRHHRDSSRHGARRSGGRDKDVGGIQGRQRRLAARQEGQHAGAIRAARRARPSRRAADERSRQQRG